METKSILDPDIVEMDGSGFTFSGVTLKRSAFSSNNQKNTFISVIQPNMTDRLDFC